LSARTHHVEFEDVHQSFFFRLLRIIIEFATPLLERRTENKKRKTIEYSLSAEELKGKK